MRARAPASGTRRVAAFAIDYAVIAAYIGFLTGLNIAVRAALHQRLALPRTNAAKIEGHAVAFLTLTVPVALYFALSEASRSRATMGKRALGLRVTRMDGGRVPLGRSLLRSAVKFAPWEVAHTAIWHTPGQPFVSPPATRNVVGYALALCGAAWYAGALFVGARRTPYDRIAGTLVVSDAADGPAATAMVGGRGRGNRGHRVWLNSSTFATESALSSRASSCC